MMRKLFIVTTLLASFTVQWSVVAPSNAQTKSAPATLSLPFELPKITPGAALSLDQALESAEQRNLSLAATRTEISRAQAELSMARSVLFPSAQGSMTLTHNDQEDTASAGGMEIVVRRQDNLSGALQVNVPLVNAQSWQQIKSARLGLDITELTVQNARQGLLLSVAQSYYQALTAQNIIDVYETQIRSTARHLEIAKYRHISGVGARLDAIRTESELEKLHGQLLAAHRALDNARDALGILTGLGGLPLPIDRPDLRPPQADEQTLIASALTEREDIRLKKAMVDLAEQQLDTSWMQFLPSLNASWQLTHQFTAPSNFGSEDRSRWFASVVLSVPIYNQTRYAELDHKRAAIQKSALEYADTKQNTAYQVRQARRDYLTTLDQIETATRQSELANQALVLAEEVYRAGTGSSLEVTDARRTSREAEINLTSKRFEAQIALLKLLRTVGTDMSRLTE